MTNIERTECVEHGAANMIGRRCHAWVGPYVLRLRDGVTMEYVPASRLAVAVEALRTLHRTDPARTLAACDEADPSNALSNAVAPPPHRGQ